MRRVLTFNGKALSDFGTYWDGSQAFIKAERSIEKIEVMGKSGDYTIDNGRYQNVTIPYHCFIRENFIDNYEALMNYLHSEKGYKRLETSVEPNVYRMAQYYEPNTPNTGAWLKYGDFTLEFDCMPQKWLKIGEHEINIHQGQNKILYNPSYQTAKPLIKVTGTGTFRINGDTCTLSTNTGVTVIDCEIQDAYEGMTNRNPYFTTTGESFPTLHQGENNVEATDVSLVIIPRWWIL